MDYLGRYSEGREQLIEWILEGRLRQEVNLVKALASAPGAFVQLTAGRTVGKTIIDLT